MKRHTITHIISCLFILLFVYAAVTKLLDHEKFMADIGQSPMLAPFADVFSVAVPVSELLTAVMLIVPRARLYGLYAALAMMVMFTTYIVVVSKVSDYVPCSCGGILSDMSWSQHLVFNLVFVVLGVSAILLYIKDIPVMPVPEDKTGTQ